MCNLLGIVIQLRCTRAAWVCTSSTACRASSNAAGARWEGSGGERAPGWDRKGTGLAVLQVSPCTVMDLFSLLLAPVHLAAAEGTWRTSAGSRTCRLASS